MPELTKLDGNHTINQVRVGDKINLTYMETNTLLRVLDVSVKNKYTYLIVSGLKKDRDSHLRDVNETPVKIWREQPTAAELKVRQDEFNEASLNRMAHAALDARDAAQLKLIGAVNDPRWASDVAYKYADAMASVALTQAYANLWLQVMGAMDTEHDGEKLDTWMKAATVVREHAIEQLTGNGDLTRATSRSTSTMHNLLNDVTREATAKFVHDLKWRIGL